MLKPLYKEFIFSHAERQKDHFKLNGFYSSAMRMHCLRLIWIPNEGNSEVKCITLMCTMWSFLSLIRFLDHIKVAYSRVIGTVGSWKGSRISCNPWEKVLSCSGYIESQCKQIFIYILQFMVKSCSLPRLFWEALQRKWFVGLTLDLTSFLLVEDYITISLIAGSACVSGSCLNGEMDLNEPWFLLLGWKLRSRGPNEPLWSEHRRRPCCLKGKVTISMLRRCSEGHIICNLTLLTSIAIFLPQDQKDF